MRKPDFCLCENKGADQLCSNCTADQRLCFRYMDSTIPLLPKSKISSILPYSLTVQAGLCQTWSETLKTGFLASRLISDGHISYEPHHKKTFFFFFFFSKTRTQISFAVIVQLISSFDFASQIVHSPYLLNPKRHHSGFCL